MKRREQINLPEADPFQDLRPFPERVIVGVTKPGLGVLMVQRKTAQGLEWTLPQYSLSRECPSPLFEIMSGLRLSFGMLSHQLSLGKAVEIRKTRACIPKAGSTAALIAVMQYNGPVDLQFNRCQMAGCTWERSLEMLQKIALLLVSECLTAELEGMLGMPGLGKRDS